MQINTYIINSEEETKQLAEKISFLVKKQTIILLKGNLGVGKTFFTNCLINAILKRENRKEELVKSPTFNLVKTYTTDNFEIYHFDLYRIKTQNELFELDLENAFNNVSIIEWPEIIENLLPYKTIDINFELNKNRIITISC